MSTTTPNYGLTKRVIAQGESYRNIDIGALIDALDNSWAVEAINAKKSDLATVCADVVALAPAVRTIIVSDTQTVSSNLTCPANAHLLVVGDGEISVDSSITFTILGSVTFPEKTIFPGSGTISFLNNRTLTEVYPQWWGGIPDGVTNNATALQKALDAVETIGTGATVRLTNGTWLTGTLEWKGQSIVGAGRLATILKGQASQDILHATTVVSYNAYRGTRIKHMTMTVNDSVNASGSFARGGVGNAAIAMPKPDGALTDQWILLGGTIEDVEFTTTGAAVANQCAALYLQAPAYQSTFKDIDIYNFTYGYWEHYPTTNLTSSPYAPDHNIFDNVATHGCVNGFRGVNGARCTARNVQIYNPPAASTGVGFELNSVVSGSSRIEPSGWVIDGLFFENSLAVTTQTPWTLSGLSHTIINPINQNSATGAGLAFGCSKSRIINLRSSQLVGTTITITGNYNRIIDCAVRERGSWVDSGIGNIVVEDNYATGINSGLQQYATQTKQSFEAWEAAAWLLGFYDPAFRSLLDLVFSPDGMESTTGGASWTTVTTDSTTLFGRYGQSAVTTPGGAYTFKKFSQKSLTIGGTIPQGRLRIAVLGRCSTGTPTQTMALKRVADNTTIGSAIALTWSTSWSAQWFEVDVSAEAVGVEVYLQGNALSNAAALDVQYVAFLPYAQQFLTGGLSTGFVSKTTTYTAGEADYWIDCDATGGAFTVSLPVSYLHKGKNYVIRKIDSSGNAITVDPAASETIDGSATRTIGTQYNAMWLISDGVNWKRITDLV